MLDDLQTRREFAEVLNTTAELYGKDLSKKLLAIYFAALKHYDLDDIRHALNVHLRDPDKGQWMPKPADIVRLIDGGSESKALQAWSQVEKAIRSIGPYQSVVFDDASTMTVIDDMGGWIDLCNTSEDELPFRSLEFQKRYRGYVQRGGVQQYPRMLIGIAQAHNEQGGHKVDPPLLIGNTAKAAALLENGSERTGLQKAVAYLPEPKEPKQLAK